MSLFNARPCNDPKKMIEMLAQSPGALGGDWKVVGEREQSPDFPVDLLLYSSKGELVLVLAVKEIDGPAFERGENALSQARQALPLLKALDLFQDPPFSKIKLMLLGGRISPGVIYRSGDEILIRCMAVVLHQPGPPFILFEPPLSKVDTNHSNGKSRFKFTQKTLVQLVRAERDTEWLEGAYRCEKQKA